MKPFAKMTAVTGWGIALSVCVCAACHAAQTHYPTRPIRLVLPFAPGGGADALARIMAPKLSDFMGQTWVVDNRGGAAGNLAAELVAAAIPDGHTLFLGFSTVLTVNPSLYKLPFDVQRDFRPITLLSTSQYLLIVHPSVQANSVKELTEFAKQKPKALNYSSAGVGSPLHLAAELFKKRAGIDMVHVAYKGGGPAAAAVLAGETQVIFGSVASSFAQVKAGRLRALATTGSKRSIVAPELPTMAESGFPGFEVTSWYGLMAPANTPAAVAARIRDDAIKTLELADVRQAMLRQGMEPEPSTPQALAARIKTETGVWAGVIRDAGIKAN